jgi:hypothetical protein
MKEKYNTLNKKLNKLKVDNEIHQQHSNHLFYQRIENMSNIELTSEEKALLSKGLKYNMHQKQKNWVKTLAIEADSAVDLLDPHEQTYMRQRIAYCLRNLTDKNTRNNARNTKLASVEKKVIRDLKQKLEENNLMVTKADKGNTLIIMSKDEYHLKIQDFITQNTFTKIRQNYTSVQQKEVKTGINTCRLTIRQKDKWRYSAMNPKAPHIHGLIKLHKNDKPIRPIVNWKDSPGYKLAKHLAKLLKHTIQLPNVFNVKNSKALMQSLSQSNVQPGTKVCSFDIKNMYTNIPINELYDVIQESLIHNSVPTDDIREIMTLVRIILKQNYFQYNDELFLQNDGLAMGAPTSSIFTEIFIQYLEHNYVVKILQKHNIIDYYRYVDDVLIIYNSECTNIQDTMQDFNNIHPRIQYTMEMQVDRKLNYLDITIEIIDNSFSFNVYRKPTTTDLIISNNSCTLWSTNYRLLGTCVTGKIPFLSLRNINRKKKRL